MKLSTGVLVGIVVASLAGPVVCALPLDVEAPPIIEDPIRVKIRGDGSVNASANTSSVVGFGEATEIDLKPPLMRSVQLSSADNAIRIPSTIETASAVAGAAIGVALLAGLWNYFKYGALVGIGGPLFSRIASHKILDNDVRNRVHECVGTNPGVTIKEITRLLGIGWGTAVYHLARLEQERFIVSERHRQFRRYFRNGGGIVNHDKTAFAELKNPMTQRLASEIANRPGSAQMELCATVGISASLAHKHLGRLEQAQLLTKRREWKTVKYFPTEKLVGLLAPHPVQAPVEAVPLLA